MEDNDEEFHDSEREEEEEVSYDSDASNYDSKQVGEKRKRASGSNGQSSKRARNTSQEDGRASTSSWSSAHRYSTPLVS